MLRQQIKLKPRSLVETHRHLDKLCRPLHSLPIAALNRRTVAARLAAIAGANGPAAANRVRGSLGAFFTWSVMEGFRDDNPVSATNKAIENGPRERLLPDAELAIIWRSLNNDQYGAVMKLLILTGLRRGEIGELCWSEIDLDADLIVISPARTKNGRPHHVPMSAPVRELLAAQPRCNEPDGSPRDPVFGPAVMRWHTEKVALDQRIVESRASRWRLGSCTTFDARSRRRCMTSSACRRISSKSCSAMSAIRPASPGLTTSQPI